MTSNFETHHNGNGHTAIPQNQQSTGLIDDLHYLHQTLPGLRTEGIGAYNPPKLSGNGEYEKFVNQNKLKPAERLLLLLTLAPHVDPDIYEILYTANNAFHFFEITGQRQLLPSGRTFIKLYANTGLADKIEAQAYLSAEHFFYKQGVIQIGATAPGAIAESGPLNIGPAYKDLFLFNHQGSPRFSDEFPAQVLETNLQWDDLVLSDYVQAALDEICKGALLKLDPESEPVLARHERPGYRAIFYGPSGTGKTEAVALIGKQLGRKVYRVNLSTVMSKYVGQTMKNLESLFNTSEHRGWILFFDEGDALFGKRAAGEQSEDSNAQHNNRDVAYLLQRIERYTGLIFVATNLMTNIDDAFSRRFESAVNFGSITREMYEKVWLRNIPKQFTLDPNIDFKMLQPNYPLTQGSIINVIKRMWKRMHLSGQTHIKLVELQPLMKDELNK